MHLNEAPTSHSGPSTNSAAPTDPWSDSGERSPDGDSASTPAQRRRYLATRALNCVLAVLALLALLPVFLLLALLIRLTSRGPVFYLQERVGLDRRGPGPDAHNHRRVQDLGGRPFTIYKFRTMQVDAERPTGVTRWGGCCASTGWTSCPSSSTCSRAR